MAMIEKYRTYGETTLCLVELLGKAKEQRAIIEDNKGRRYNWAVNLWNSQKKWWTKIA